MSAALTWQVASGRAQELRALERTSGNRPRRFKRAAPADARPPAAECRCVPLAGAR